MALGLVLAQSFTACETVDFGDTNENVNGPKEVYPAGLLAGAIETFSTMTGRDPFLKPTLYVQYQSQVTYTDEMLYAETPSSWNTYYARILPALNQVISYNMDEDNQLDPNLLAQGDPMNQAGVAMIYRAIVLKRLTDTWGDVPFSEAVQGLKNLTPAYDKQEDIYRQLIDDLKAGRDMLDESASGPKGDLIYGGDVAKWKKLANSVLLQASLQLSEVSSSKINPAEEFRAALADPAGVIEDVSDEAWYKFDAIAEYQNPFNPNRKADYFLSAEFVDAFQGDGGEYNPTSSKTYDARIEVYSKNPALEGVPYGFNDASGSGKNQVSPTHFWSATAPLPLMTASYTYLNRAEAAERGWTEEVAVEMLTKGIKLSFESLDTRKEVDIAEDANVYTAARLADALRVGMLQVIGEEKWKTLFPQGFDAWAEWRRTGYPNLKPATHYLNDGGIVRRYLYPIDERTLNATSFNAGITGLKPATDKNTSRVWWDVD
ncbi:SusD/RagB family nutrient-binding outer membrane lipoprotein [Pontibacter mucosus]|nr:SusD/RagB family nutrient-binding outer membrane lipoprotein [Pontibacter mucosus]